MWRNRMSKMGVDCDALPRSSKPKPVSPQRPLSKSLRRSASNRSIETGDRGRELLASNPKPQTPPRSLFSLQTTTSPSSAPHLPPLPVARSKLLARSLTFSSLDSEKLEKPRPAAIRSASNPLPLEANIVTSPNNDLTGVTPAPARFVKSIFGSSAFSALRARSFRSWPAADDGAMEIPESSPYSLLAGSSAKRASQQRASPIVELENSLGVLTKGLLDSSRIAVKAVQDKARHLVNKRHQDSGFQLDMVYITENIIAMGFPDNDTTSGPDILGFKEGNYRDNVEELVTFCETQHLDKYKIFNLCSERLYDTSLFHDKVTCFPFEGNSCPPLLLITAFCEAACKWLKAGLENVVVVHSKRGMARTGIMISCLLLHLKFFPNAEESVNHYNQKRCVDSNGLILPSQLQYVKYYEQVLKKHYGFTPTGRRCTLRSIRLINCPSWICPAVTVSDHDGVLFTSKKHPKTRSMLAEDVWLSGLKSGVLLFELPDDGHAAAVDGDFKIHFQDRNVDFSCWLNTNMVGSGNVVLRLTDLDGYEKGLLQEATGFQVELELLDTYVSVLRVTGSSTTACTDLTATDGETDSDLGEEEASGGFRSLKAVVRKQVTYDFGAGVDRDGSSSRSEDDVINLAFCDDLRSDFQALAAASAADASLFTFGDDEDYDSDET